MQLTDFPAGAISNEDDVLKAQPEFAHFDRNLGHSISPLVNELLGTGPIING
jgi:hypothetical protein